MQDALLRGSVEDYIFQNNKISHLVFACLLNEYAIWGISK